ncbi:MAG: ankyrin repeat domain-containing protein, partial [Alphaproteobacteria bacterium]|nr:ankyrin repeat domain-containing protein [Alphaproteobacteria bacterium]
NAKDQNGMTPLHIAAYNNLKKNVKILLDAEADPEEKNNDGLTSAACARAKGYGAVAEILQNHMPIKPEGSVVPAGAAVEKQENALLLKVGSVLQTEKSLLEMMTPGVRGDGKYNDDGMTSLHIAAHKGYAKLVRRMIAAGADVNLRSDDTKSWTPLHYAVAHRNTDTVLALVKGGADPTLYSAGNENSGRKQTPIHIAVNERQEDILLLLARSARKEEILPEASIAEEPDTVWQKQGDTKIAQVETLPALSRRITTLFNFNSGQCTVMTENLETGHEAVCSNNMAEMNAAAVQSAADEFIAQGGDAKVVKKSLSPRVRQLTQLPKGRMEK